MFERDTGEAARLVRAMDEGTAAMAAASAEVLEAVADFDEHALWRADGATSMTPWLAARYSLTWGTAREWVRVARALRVLPAIARVYAAGRMSWDQLRPLSRFATPEDDEHWAARAPSRSPGWLWREARRHERVVRDQAEGDARMRRLWMQWDEERRFLCLGGELPAEQGAAVQAALERRAEQVVVEDGLLYDPQGARLADALVELVCSEEAGGGAPVLVVHSDASILAGIPDEGGPTLSETESGVPLAQDTIRRLACHAGLEWVVHQDGRSIGIGRRSRRVDGWLMRQLRFNDRHCRFPGCERTKWLRAHHVKHWAHGGSTDLDNLILLCHAHHRLVHEGGWTIRGRPHQDLRFHDPGGQPLQSMAEVLPTYRATA